MKMKIISFLCLAGLSSMSAFASIGWFTVNTAVANFTEQDTLIFKQAVNKALNNYPDNKKLTWHNPKTTAHGYLIPSHTTNNKGMRCRKLKIYNEARAVKGKSQFRFCWIDGEWKVAQ